MQSVLQAVAQSQNIVLQLTTCQGDRGGGRGGADKASQPSEECFARQQNALIPNNVMVVRLLVSKAK